MYTHPSTHWPGAVLAGTRRALGVMVVRSKVRVMVMVRVKIRAKVRVRLGLRDLG